MFHDFEVIGWTLQFQNFLTDLLFLQPAILNWLDFLELWDKELLNLYNKCLFSCLYRLNYSIEAFFGRLHDFLEIFLKTQFGMPDIQEYILCFLKLKQTIFCCWVYLSPYIFWTLFYFTDVVPFVWVEHEARRTDHAE